MDSRQLPRPLDPAWRRWTLLAALLALGILYIAAFAVFVVHSENFIEKKRNHDALVYARSHRTAIPSTLSFRSDSADAARLGGGWHKPDAPGVWSSGRRAWIALAVTDTRDDLLLRLNLTAFAPRARPHMQIALDVDGQPLGSWMRSADDSTEPLDVRVPAALLRGREVTITVRTDHVDSPLRLGVGSDDRKLGVLLSSIELRRAPTR